VETVLEELEETSRSGIFSVSPEKKIFGELKLSGRKTNLYVWDKEFFNIDAACTQAMQGVLHDLTKVTLIDCITSSVPGTRVVGAQKNYFADVFPHFVTIGNNHIFPEQHCITDIHFVISDATSLFYDFDAFGHVIDAKPLIEDVVKANNLDRGIEIGAHPQIAYFAGKTEILSVDTALGRVSVRHAPGWNMGGPKGVKIDNTIVINLRVENAINFHEAIDRTDLLLQFFGLLAGRRQNLQSLTLQIKSDDDVAPSVQVYWSMRPKREASEDESTPNPSDVLLNGGLEPEAFSLVLEGWLERAELWRDARYRHFSSFVKERSYDIDRLIAVTNMFDILPPSAVPSDVLLDKNLKNARDTCRKVFKDLPLSPERDSI
jgi:hypothetical protein